MGSHRPSFCEPRLRRTAFRLRSPRLSPYDLLDRLTYTTYPGSFEMGFAYDAAGRKTAEGSNWFGTTRSQYDADGNRKIKDTILN